MHYNYNSNSPLMGGRRRSMGAVSITAASTLSGVSAGVLTTRYAAYTHASGQKTGIKPAQCVMRSLRCCSGAH